MQPDTQSNPPHPSPPSPSPPHTTLPPLPPAVVQRLQERLGALVAGLSPGDEPPPPTAELLAEGDHATRMLKDLGDGLDRRLPQPPQVRGWVVGGRLGA